MPKCCNTRSARTHYEKLIGSPTRESPFASIANGRVFLVVLTAI